MRKADEEKESRNRNALESMGVHGPVPLVPRATASATSRDPRQIGMKRSQDVAVIEVGRIERDPTQPREEFDEEDMANLAESLREYGQLQPIRVRWDEGRGVYIIISGERRWRAAGLAGLPTLTCVIAGDAPRHTRLTEQLIENLQRSDLKPVEQAKAFRELMELNGWSARELARQLHISQSWVSRGLTLLDLPTPVQDLVEQGSLAVSSAVDVASQLDTPEEQHEAAQLIVEEGLNRSESREFVRALRSKRKEEPGPTPWSTEFPNGVRVTVQWKHADPMTAESALRHALKAIKSVSAA